MKPWYKNKYKRWENFVWQPRAGESTYRLERGAPFQSRQAGCIGKVEVAARWMAKKFAGFSGPELGPHSLVKWRSHIWWRSPRVCREWAIATEGRPETHDVSVAKAARKRSPGRARAGRLPKGPHTSGTWLRQSITRCLPPHTSAQWCVDFILSAMMPREKGYYCVHCKGKITEGWIWSWEDINS